LGDFREASKGGVMNKYGFWDPLLEFILCFPFVKLVGFHCWFTKIWLWH